MNRKKIVFTVFLLVALVQLYIPAKMIWEREEVLDSGTAYKFKTAPIDPTDPFRGKYITLSYDENTVEVESEKDWAKGDKIYIHLTVDSNGFAKIKSASKEKPPDRQDHLKVKVNYVSGNGSNTLTIDYPFDRFYMEESKAYDAELTYRKSQRDTSKVTYALVSIKNGEAVLKDVLIDGIPIREIVKTNQEENKY
ncbi:MAG: GDYXXLXY domain-containing protein [Bacteroidota bacterium]